MKKVLLSLVVVIGLLSFVGCEGSKEPQGGSGGDRTPYEPTITQSQYDAVEMGMSYSQVVEIFGREGYVSSGSGNDPSHPSAVCYVWYNAPVSDDARDFHGIMVAFDNGAAYTKEYTP